MSPPLTISQRNMSKETNQQPFSETPLTPLSSLSSRDPYYTNKVFNRFVPLVGIYTLVANLVLFFLKPFPSLVSDIILSPKQHVSPEESFALPSPNDYDNNNNNDNDNQHIAIVTGSNTGIGYETASSLVGRGYDVILACRSRDKGEQAAQKINAKYSNANNTSNGNANGKAIFLHPLDLSSLQSVRSFVKVYTNKWDHLNILINNAGINSSGKSIDGMDLCFQTNFVGHYLLTRMLIPQLLKAKNRFTSKDGGISNNGVEAGRVVNLSSVTHHFAGASEERQGVKTNGEHDEEWWRGCAMSDTSGNTYKESKMAALLLTEELNKRYGSQGLRAVSANPGSVNSDIWRNFPPYMIQIHNAIFLTTKEGSSTSFAAAIGDLPKGAVYLQPYWQPWGKRKSSLEHSKSSFYTWYSLPVPFSEMGGVYIGYAVTDCRLPSSESSVAMWNVCEELVGMKETM